MRQIDSVSYAMKLDERTETDDGDTGEWTIGCGYDVMYAAPGIARQRRTRIIRRRIATPAS